MAMLATLISPGSEIDLDRLERFMGMQKEWQAAEAHRLFLEAMAEFRAHAPKLEKNCVVDFTTAKGRTSYKHADLEEVSIPIGNVMGPLGLSFRWVPEQKNSRVYVTTILEHKAGHRETLTLDGPIDDSGNKNAIQGVGSTITYLSRYGLLAISGMAVKGEDNDGRGSADDAAGMEEATYQKHVRILSAASDMTSLQAAFKIAWQEAGKDTMTKKALTTAYDNRKAKLRQLQMDALSKPEGGGL
jgi:hypothetical protein